MPKEKVPKVSVCVNTYNQDKYIRQCLQSIVDQETDFDFEVIVSDDCSTDGTRAIVQEFSDRYPEVVKPIFHENNIGAYKSFILVHEQARGEFVAHVDGDDYCLPGKLKAQADFLDLNPTCNIVWHRVQIQDPLNDQLIADFNRKTLVKGVRFYLRDLLLIGSIGCHSSKMYRREYLIPLDNRKVCLDYYTDVLQIRDGYAAILEGRYGVYRRGGGISSGNRTKQLYLSHQKEFLGRFPQYKYEIAANAFIVFLADIKNKRKTWIDALQIWTSVNPIFMATKLVRYIHLFYNLRAISD